MKFDPALPRDTVNATPLRPLRDVVVLIGGLILVAVVFVVLVGAAIDLAAPWVPPGAERWLPTGVVARLFDVEHAAVPEIEVLLERLARHWPDRPFIFHAAVWDVPLPNALALPGGLVVVTTGLLDDAESENELAFVLGHELGHFRHRDHLRGLGRGLAFGLLAVVLDVGGGDGGTWLARAGASLADRRYDRNQERAADRFGLELVAAEYGHVAGAKAFFERLQRSEGERRASAYTSTHPLTRDRIADLEREAVRRGFGREGRLGPPLGGS